MSMKRSPEQTSDNPAGRPLTRRGLVGGLTLAATAVASSGAMAQGVHGFRRRVEEYRDNTADNPPKSWGSSILPGRREAAAASNTPDLLQSATTALALGDDCRKYCEKQVAGDASLQACLDATRAMLPVTSALAKLSEINAARLKEMAETAIAFLDDCRAECLKNADKDAVFRNCANGCEACAAQCRKLMGA